MLFPGGHAASICDNTPEGICRVLDEEEEDFGVTIIFLKFSTAISW
jgi:energy-converting hydrogenase Eha subunit E